MCKNRKVIPVIALILGVFLFSTALQAGSNKGKSGKPNSQQEADKNDFDVDWDLSVMVSAGISIGDARVLASRHEITGGKPLPPGIRKNLARGKPLPPGIQKNRMSGSFVNDLPHHEGYEWHQAGTDLVLVVSGSLVISDILKGMFD